MSRYVELENVQILPDGNIQQVYMRYTNMVGGKLYPNTGTSYSQANFKIKLSTFDGLTAPILIYQPQEQILLWNNYFKNSYGVQIYNTADPDDNVTKYTTTTNVSIWNNVFEPTSSGFMGGYAINYQRGPDRDSGYYLDVNSISHNAFLMPNPVTLSNQTAIKLESSINGQVVINDINVYDNYFGDLDENLSVMNAGKFVLNRIIGEGNNATYLDCNTATSTHCVNGPGYVYKLRVYMNDTDNYYVEPLSNKTLGSLSLLEYETLTLEKGNYNGLVGSASSIINIPNGSTLEIHHEGQELLHSV